MYILNAFGILPSSFITANSMQIGSALQVILLSLALADRINIIRKEKEEAQALAIDNLRRIYVWQRLSVYFYPAAKPGTIETGIKGTSDRSAL